MSKRGRGHQQKPMPSAAVAPPIPTGPKIPALVEELRAATSEMDSDVVNKRARILDNALKEMSPDMQARFEFYMRSHFDYKAVKKVLQKEIDCTVTDFASGGHSGDGGPPIFVSTSWQNARAPGVAPTVTDDMAIVVCGLAKLYVGELVDTAKDVMMERLTSLADTELVDKHVPVSNPVAEDAGSAGGVNQSAFNMISSLGAQVTNEAMHLTKADIEEAARRIGDKGMHARGAGPVVSLFSDAPASAKFASVASILGQDRETHAEWSQLIGSINDDSEDEGVDDSNMKEEQGEILPSEKAFSKDDEEALQAMVANYSRNVLDREAEHQEYSDWQEQQQRIQREAAEQARLGQLQAQAAAAAAQQAAAALTGLAGMGMGK